MAYDAASGAVTTASVAAATQEEPPAEAETATSTTPSRKPCNGDHGTTLAQARSSHYEAKETALNGKGSTTDGSSEASHPGDRDEGEENKSKGEKGKRRNGRDGRALGCPATTAPWREEPPLTPEEQQAVRKDRRDRAREAKLAQSKAKDKSAHQQQQRKQGERKRRWGSSRRGKGKKKSQNAAEGDGGRGPKDDSAPDLFDEWLGLKLSAWKGEGAAATPMQGGGELLARPPEGSGVDEEIDFDPSKDEIAFPTCLSALQRRQVHGWAMQLALFHASSGEDQQRHVIISKTGVFQGKLLTRGGRTWYKEGVEAPLVKRFALQPGHETIAKPIVAALHRFHESVQLGETGFDKWLRENTPPAAPLDGSGWSLEVKKAQEAISKWPKLDEVEFELINTPEKLAALAGVLESCREFGFDLEAHNARTYHGLCCLVQISTETKDYIVDPLEEGMWDSMHLLRGPFSKADVLKIGHGIRSLDTPSLYRDFGIVVLNAIDTEETVHALGDKHSGLAAVLGNAGITENHDIAGLKKTMQTCDWRERPLSAEKLVYARCDSHYLIPLWRFLRARLMAADTFSNREEAKEEEELREIERRLDEYQRRKEESTGRGHVLAPPVAVTVPAVGKSPGKSPARSGANSPAQLTQEPWVSEWDDPEDCHRRERSRSGSFFRSDLESINESAKDVSAEAAGGGGAGAGGGRDSAFNTSLGNALTEVFFEADGEEDSGKEEDDEVSRLTRPVDGTKTAETSAISAKVDDDHGGGSVDHRSHAVLGHNLIGDGDGEGEGQEDDEGDDEEDDGEDDGEDDEDEDMWEGWGEDTTAGGVEDHAATVVVAGGGGGGGGAGEVGSGVATAPLPPSPQTSPSTEPFAGRGASLVCSGDEDTGANATAAENDGDGGSAVLEDARQGSTGVFKPDVAGGALPLQPTSTSISKSSSLDAASGPVNGGGDGVRGRRSRTAMGAHRVGMAKADAVEPEAVVVLTDGVRLVWRALSRTHAATANLWRPAREARREDSHNERHFRTAVQRLKPPRWSEVNVRVYEEIYLWRDRTARRMDDGPAYVCPGDILIDVALAMPKTLDDLRRVSAPLSPVLGHADTPEAAELVRVVRLALGLSAEDAEQAEGRPGSSRGGSFVATGDVSAGARSALVGSKSATFLAAAAAAMAAVGVCFALSGRSRK